MALTLAGCSTVESVQKSLFGGSLFGPDVPESTRIEGFIGAVAADEPRAVLIGREVLAQGGSAGDAVLAMAFAMTVTYPSRASLGAGGACIAYNPESKSGGTGQAEAFIFTAPPTPAAQGADRPAAAPMLARGMFALHARYGSAPFERLIIPAETMARFGVLASRAFVRDLALVSGPLLADPGARAIFAKADGSPLTEGSQLLQPELGATLGQIRTSGAGDLYQGGLAARLVEASQLAGGGLRADDLRAALPRVAPAVTLRVGNDLVAFAPTDGGLAAAAAFSALQTNPADGQAAQARALSVAASVRRGASGDPAAVIASSQPPASFGPLGASTSFAALDRNGMAVTCALSMNNLFGTGRIAPGTGILLAASPSPATAPLLAGSIAYNANVRGFRAAVASSGQDASPLATAIAMNNALRGLQAMPAQVPEPGRANAISCYRYLPGAEGACSWATDPRGAGLALGAN